MQKLQRCAGFVPRGTKSEFSYIFWPSDISIKYFWRIDKWMRWVSKTTKEVLRPLSDASSPSLSIPTPPIPFFRSQRKMRDMHHLGPQHLSNKGGILFSPTTNRNNIFNWSIREPIIFRGTKAGTTLYFLNLQPRQKQPPYWGLTLPTYGSIDSSLEGKPLLQSLIPISYKFPPSISLYNWT